MQISPGLAHWMIVPNVNHISNSIWLLLLWVACSNGADKHMFIDKIVGRSPLVTRSPILNLNWNFMRVFKSRRAQFSIDLVEPSPIHHWFGWSMWLENWPSPSCAPRGLLVRRCDMRVLTIFYFFSSIIVIAKVTRAHNIYSHYEELKSSTSKKKTHRKNLQVR